MRRLFIGCPIPASVAIQIEDWTRQELEGVRIVPPENLHVTLMFLGEVTAEADEKLAALTRTATWTPLPVTTSGLSVYGSSALALELRSPLKPHDLSEPIRFSATSRESSDDGRSEESATEWRGALFYLALCLHEAETLRSRRQRRPDQQWPLHITVARSRAGFSGDLLAKRFPKTAFTLDRLALYESHLSPSGASYEIVAEAGCQS